MEQANSQSPASPAPAKQTPLASQPDAGSKPPANNNHAAKFAFFYMLSLLALVIMSVSSGIVVFQIINKYVRDYLSSSSYYSADAIHFALSGIFVAAPIYYLTMWQIQKNLRQGALSLDSNIRKWLTYFILFVSSAVSIIWLITTVNNFLRGEITERFILKALTAIGISMAIFIFYLYDIKRQQIDEHSRFVVRAWFLASLLAILTIFIAGIIVEPPYLARARRHDEIVLQRLNNIDNSLEQYYHHYKYLPPSLEDLFKDKNSYLYDRNTIYNPDNHQLFVYKKISSTTYKICANFQLDSKSLEKWGQTVYFNKKWPHQAGQQCFQNNVGEQNSNLPHPIQVEPESTPLN